jgi:MATE family multidrug resistance protein
MSARGELRAQVVLAAPLAAQQVGQVTMGLVDTALLGRFEPAAMAGAGLGNALLFALSCLGIGLVLGLDPVLAQSVGAGQPGRTRGQLGAGVALAVKLGLVFTVVLALVPLALRPLGVAPAVAAEAEVYLWARSLSVVPLLAQVAVRAFLQVHGRTAPLVWAAIIGNVINAILDWILIFGDQGLTDLGLPAIGLPPLGTLGAAVATSAVTIATLVIFVASARPIARRLPPTPVDRARDTRAIVRVGLPIGLTLFAEVAAFALAAVLAGRLGEVPAAAHQIALQLASVSFSLAIGIGGAAATRVGLAVGAGDRAGARRAALVALGLGGAVMATSATAFVLASTALAAAFTDRADVIATAATLIQIAAVFQLSDGAQAIASGALRGAGDTKASFVANLAGHYGVGLPIALVLGFAFDRGAPGLWWGLTAGLTGTAIALVGRLWWLTGRPIAPVDPAPDDRGVLL